jgi:outer membrane protein assembly factor BamB
VPATIHGRACVLIFAGGKSRPPTGGLVCLDAADGQVLCAVPHRARITESVSASSPVVIGNQVFVTESYGSGGELIEIGEDFSAHSVWKAPHFGAYFMTPVVKDGMIIGCDGQSPQLTALAALDVKSGQERWRNDLGGKFGRSNVLLVDGGAYVLGEFGSFGWLNLSRAGATLEHECQLFHAPDTWTLPALSRGLLYVSQNQRSDAGKAPRMICYDVRAAK